MLWGNFWAAALSRRCTLNFASVARVGVVTIFLFYFIIIFYILWVSRPTEHPSALQRRATDIHPPAFAGLPTIPAQRGFRSVQQLLKPDLEIRSYSYQRPVSCSSLLNGLCLNGSLFAAHVQRIVCLRFRIIIISITSNSYPLLKRPHVHQAPFWALYNACVVVACDPHDSRPHEDCCDSPRRRTWGWDKRAWPRPHSRSPAEPGLEPPWPVCLQTGPPHPHPSRLCGPCHPCRFQRLVEGHLSQGKSLRF